MFRKKLGKITAEVTEDEAKVLRSVIGQYLDLLENDQPPGDPVMERLLPSASLDDEEVDRKYRDLALNELQNHKRSTANTALQCLPHRGAWSQELSPDETEAWLVVLGDVRLAIGTRIGVTEELMSRPVDPEDPDEWPMAVLHYLGALQENLVEALSD